MDTPSTGTVRYGRFTTAAIVVAASIGAGLLAGLISGLSGLAFPVAFVILLGPLNVFLWTFVLRRPAAVEPFAAGHVVLLDATAKGTRLVQSIGPLAGTLAAVMGLSQLIRADGGTALSASALVIGILITMATLLYPITWTVPYKGHTIRFRNHPCLAEQLWIDGRLVARGGIGVLMVLRGTIEGGDGAGHRITATSRAGLATLSCRIVAEPAVRV